MKVEVEESVNKSIKWGESYANFINGVLADFQLIPKAEDIRKDSQGAIEFFTAIHKELLAKKSRKTRSDAGISKKPKSSAMVHTETGAEYKAE